MMLATRAALLVLGVSLTVPLNSVVGDYSQGRSLVIAREGIVAAEHPLAAQAGATILARGGHAVDAAVAANAVMGVVAPMSNGIGGDLFALIYDTKSSRLYGLNASGWAPAGLSIEFLKSRGYREMPDTGIHTVTVPGAVDGWAKLLARFGRKTFADVLAPAIGYAKQGVPVTERVADLWRAGEPLLLVAGTGLKVFFPGGRAPRVGDLFHNADLAWSYQQIAEQGRDEFYRGEIARRIVEFSQRHGGALTTADLEEFSSEWVEPLSTTYRGWSVYELPPNSQGIAALLMLNIMEQFPLADYGHNNPRALHVMIEAKKLAYADLMTYIGDPKFAQIPITGLLSKEYARARARLIEPEHARCDVGPGNPVQLGRETIYLSVVDRDGNMVSLIQSIYASFGAGLVPDGTGFALQNRGALFSVDSTHPNALASRKRSLHTIIPAFMSRGDLRLAFGIMGGWNQAQAHAQFVANVVDHGLNIQAALEAPRFTKMTFAGCDVEMESRVAKTVIQELEAKDHQVHVLGAFSPRVGGGQAVLREARGINFGASDPRKDGAAIPEPAS
jgi:gamma-glutamyltranspeptidase/glutathione hydrolase